MGLYQSMQTSTRLETEGIWLELPGTRIKLSRAGGKNTKFTVAAEKIAREHKRALDLMGEAQGRKLFAKLFAEVIVLDWLTESEDGDLDEDGLLFPEDAEPGTRRWKRGIDRPDGTIADFNVENVLKTFDDLPDLLKMVKETAEDASLYRQELLKGIEGN